MININLAQKFMQKNKIDAWVLYDFRGSNPILWHLLGEKKFTTRRLYLVIPKKGDLKLLSHQIDKAQLAQFKISKIFYINWQTLDLELKKLLKNTKNIATEYSPKGELPIASYLDAGTFEKIKSMGIKIISSSDLFQISASSWSEKSLRLHLRACKETAEIKDLAFSFIRGRLNKKQSITEYDVQQFILNEFKKRGLETEDSPVVAINSNASDPHYEPSLRVHSDIKEGDLILIDLWARYPNPEAVFSDITWMGYVGDNPPKKIIEIFNIVKVARDRVVQELQTAWKKKESQTGWQLDNIARNFINQSGYEKYFIHRTGHSIGPGSSVHALGLNLDNFETHDTRSVLPGIGFTIEPGIYLPKFGIRLEINIYIDPKKGPLITTPIQNELVLI